MSTDENLLKASCDGDRDAFGALVRRYQGMVSGLTFHGTGDLATSEELAQQAFVTAWRQRTEVREPGKLAGWLAGIARNVVRHHRRVRGRERASSEEAIGAVEDGQPSPLDTAIREEQSRLLWSVLEQLAEPYRETLVLYYRCEQSVAEVAIALEISEDAAKQRLSRGRKMLRDEVAQRIEVGLRDSRPGEKFSMSVLAALPAGLPVATGGGLLKLLFSKLPWFGAWMLGPLIGVAGAVVGARCSLKSARSEEERGVLFRVLGGVILLAAALVALQLGMAFEVGGFRSSAWGQAAVWGGYALILTTLVVRGNSSVREIRERRGDPLPLASRGDAEANSMSPRARRWNLLATVGGSSMWLMLAAGFARDWVCLVLFSAALAVVTAGAWHRIVQCGTAISQLRLYAGLMARLTVLWCVVVALRWSDWVDEGLTMSRGFTTFGVVALLVGVGGGCAAGLFLRARWLKAREAVGGG